MIWAGGAGGGAPVPRGSNIVAAGSGSGRDGHVPPPLRCAQLQGVQDPRWLFWAAAGDTDGSRFKLRCGQNLGGVLVLGGGGVTEQGSGLLLGGPLAAGCSGLSVNRKDPSHVFGRPPPPQGCRLPDTEDFVPLFPCSLVP